MSETGENVSKITLSRCKPVKTDWQWRCEVCHVDMYVDMYVDCWVLHVGAAVCYRVLRGLARGSRPDATVCWWLGAPCGNYSNTVVMLIVGVLHVGAAVCCSVLQRLARSSRLDTTKYLSWLLDAPSGELIVGVLHVGTAVCSSVLRRLARGSRPDSTKYVLIVGCSQWWLDCWGAPCGATRVIVPCRARRGMRIWESMTYTDFFFPRVFPDLFFNIRAQHPAHPLKY